MAEKLTIARPDDWHVHFRDGDMLKAVLPETARHFARAIVMPNLELAKTIKQQLWILSPFSLTTLGIFLMVGLFLRYHRYGREIFAIGGGRNEAIAAGVPLARPLIIAFGLSGTIAAITGALLSVKSGSAAPQGFENLLLPAVTAALIGGVSLFGGKGSALGIVTGTLTIRFLVSGLSLRGAPYYVERLAVGVLLHLLVMAAGERVFELLFVPQDGRWFIQPRGPSAGRCGSSRFRSRARGSPSRYSPRLA